jgi:DNA-binding MarR family transcriptional regulator
MTASAHYRLQDQIGFVLRRAHQRHAAIFADRMPHGLTPPQFSALVKLSEAGPQSQNLLGRRVALDAATIKGVVDRLSSRGLVAVTRDPEDQRRVQVALTDEGTQALADALPVAMAISTESLAPLTPEERTELLGLLEILTCDPETEGDAEA